MTSVFCALRPSYRWLLLALLMPLPALAHGDGDHHHDAEPVSTERPKRLADGRLWLSRLSQQQLAIQSQSIPHQTLSASVELNARVIADPNARALVQPSLRGRLQAPASGLPLIGQKVRKGQILAYIEPVWSPLERSSREAEIAQLSARQQQARRQLQRYQQLRHSVAGRELEAAASELAGLDTALTKLKAGLSQQETLRAPIEGVVLQRQASLGQIVNPEQSVFELLDPAGLLIEAQLYDLSRLAELGNAQIRGSQLPLTLVSHAASLQQGALPVLYRSRKPDPSLILGQALSIVVSSADQQSGWPVPKTALVQTDGQTAVWLQIDAEHFQLQPVQIQPLDAQQVLAEQLPDKPVVVQGASMLDQIR